MALHDELSSYKFIFVKSSEMVGFEGNIWKTQLTFKYVLEL